MISHFQLVGEPSEYEREFSGEYLIEYKKALILLLQSGMKMSNAEPLAAKWIEKNIEVDRVK